MVQLNMNNGGLQVKRIFFLMELVFYVVFN